MKLLIILTVVTLVAAHENHYDHKYDNLDVDGLVASNRLLHSYAHCFIGDGKCTPEGKDVKKWIPEGSKSACAKCTDKQKVIVTKFIRAIQEKLPEEWKILSKQSDPEGKYSSDLEKFLQDTLKTVE